MLFVLGGLVRSTGSGMGCPDWPKCFGSYIPPTSAEQLPDNYKEIFLEKRLSKAERFASILNKLGMKSKAEELLAYEQLSEAHEFSAAKAYTEYINRLAGAFTGLVVLLSFISAALNIKAHPKTFIYTLLGFLFVMLNALIGAVVVHVNLFGGLVSVHFLAAFAALAFFMLARFSWQNPELSINAEPKAKRIAIAVFILMCIQLYFGTLVRENYDLMEAAGHVLSIHTISELGAAFNVHRTLALVVLLLAYLQFKTLNQSLNKDKMLKYAKYVIGLFIAQIVFGSLIVMTDLSAFSKLFHISLGAALFILQFYICSLLIRSPKRITAA